MLRVGCGSSCHACRIPLAVDLARNNAVQYLAFDRQAGPQRMRTCRRRRADELTIQSSRPISKPYCRIRSTARSSGSRTRVARIRKAHWTSRRRRAASSDSEM